jgi:hypothetical protein
MTDQTDTTTADTRALQHRAARDFARQAVHGLARELGAQATSQPMFRHDPGSPAVRDYDPAAGMRAARAVELAARRMTRDYVKVARQDGMTWREIGETLGLSAPADWREGSVADAAFDFAAGPADSHYARTYGRSFGWTCPACLGVVSDHGPVQGPRDDEPGHKDGCQRLAAAIAAWEAQWAALDEDEG